MRRFVVALTVFGAAAGAAAQTPVDTFDFRDASLPDTEARMRACLGRPEWDAKRTLEGARNMGVSSETRLTGAPAVIATQRGRWACVQRTQAGFPVWPVEALDNIATLKGVDPQALRAWQLALLAQVRASGHALGLVKWPKGNAHEIEIDVQPGSALYAKWHSRDLAAGSYDEGAYSTVLDGTGLKSISSTQIGGSTWYSVVPPRAVMWPVVDNFPVLPGTSETTAERLAGTSWSRDKDRMKLEADGRMTLTAAIPRTGTWRVVAPGVLQLSWSDQAYETLRLTSDGSQLAGIRRRTQPGRDDDPAREWQNGSVFELVRTTQPATTTALPPPTVAASTPVTSSPARLPVTSAVAQRIALMLRFERDLKGVGTPDDAEALLAAPGRALWSAERVQAFNSTPPDLEASEAIALISVNKRLADQFVPYLKTATKAFEGDPLRYGEAYLNLTDLLMRSMATNVQLLKRALAKNPGNDTSGQAAASVLLMQSSLQTFMRGRQQELPRFIGPIQAQAAARLQMLREDFPEAAQPLDVPAR